MKYHNVSSDDMDRVRSSRDGMNRTESIGSVSGYDKMKKIGIASVVAITYFQRVGRTVRIRGNRIFGWTFLGSHFTSNIYLDNKFSDHTCHDGTLECVAERWRILDLGNRKLRRVLGSPRELLEFGWWNHRQCDISCSHRRCGGKSDS